MVKSLKVLFESFFGVGKTTSASPCARYKTATLSQARLAAPTGCTLHQLLMPVKYDYLDLVLFTAVLGYGRGQASKQS